jgi:thiol-disulfide isomerase/thioredoxin
MITKLHESDFILQSLDTKRAKVGRFAQAVVLIKMNWCGFCVSYMPTFEQFSVKHPDVKFFVVEGTENEQLLEQWRHLAHPVFQVNGFPTVLLYNGSGHPVSVIDDRFKLEQYL